MPAYLMSDKTMCMYTAILLYVYTYTLVLFACMKIGIKCIHCHFTATFIAGQVDRVGEKMEVNELVPFLPF